MRTLPAPRGPLSASCSSTRLRGAPAPLCVDRARPRRRDPLADDDLQLALYVAYELHYGGFAGVDERWEWEPSLLALRARSRSLRGGAARGDRGPRRGAAPEEMDLALRAIADADDAPSLSSYMEREGTREQVREFLVHRSAYQLKEADPHSWALPRLRGAPKAALVEIQADEYGGGRAERVHAHLFARAMEALGLDSDLRRVPRRIPGVTLATVNLMSLLGLHRRRRGAIVGHLALSR